MRTSTLALLCCLGACALPTATPRFEPRPVAAADPGSALPAGWQHGAFMQVFVRAYADSDGDGIGDLRGLIGRLDYLKDLGIQGLWLLPVTTSADHDHGYAVTDFRRIEPAYGTMADFDELLHQAHQRGIGVIVDYVINHAADQHPAFVQARSTRDSPWRDWFVWQDEAPEGWRIFDKNPWTATPTGHYFGTFSARMPDFNLRNPAVLAWHQDNLRHWLNRGVDGFRFDAVAHLVENGPQAWKDQPENHAILRELRALMGGYRHRHGVCEATAQPEQWAGEQACGSAFAFELSGQVLGAARGQPQAIAQVAAYFTKAPLTMATMLANHDLFAGRRVWDQLAGDAAAYRLAAATYLLLPGTPFIYYGEEIGMAGLASLPGDAQLRTPMSWTADAASAGFSAGQPFRALSPNRATHNVAAALQDPGSLLAFYKAMLSLRRHVAPIARGSYEAPQVQGTAFAFQRKLGEQHALVLINYGREATTLRVAGLGAHAAWSNEHPAGGAPSRADAEGTIHFALAPQSVRVLQRQP
ncbi:MAG: alpha-amylase [Burkholderiales bacterium]|nr:alpha-amylase [Burkholderiales bacterium]